MIMSDLQAGKHRSCSKWVKRKSQPIPCYRPASCCVILRFREYWQPESAQNEGVGPRRRVKRRETLLVSFLTGHALRLPGRWSLHWKVRVALDTEDGRESQVRPGPGRQGSLSLQHYSFATLLDLILPIVSFFFF